MVLFVDRRRHRRGIVAGVVVVELTVKNLISDLLAGASADYEARRYGVAIVTCERIRTLMRDHFMPTATVDELITEISAERDRDALDKLWDKEQLEDLKW